MIQTTSSRARAFGTALCLTLILSAAFVLLRPTFPARAVAWLRPPAEIPSDASAAPAMTTLALAAATLASEDLTCVAAGQLIGKGVIGPAAGTFGCFLGIYAGDLGLWLAGRLFGRRLFRWPWLARRVPEAKVQAMGDWFDQRPAKAVLAARFLPGTRLAMYVAAGAMGRRGGRFALWTFVASLIWTPALVLAVAAFGDAVARPLRAYLGRGAGVVAAAVLFWLAVRLVGLMMTPLGRAKVVAAVSRLWRWEFWPAWAFYAPVALWIAVLSVRRGGLRGFASVTAANPGIPDGGFVGESKYQILSSLCPRHVVPTVLIEPGDAAERVARLNAAIRERGWSFPIILKPDVGQRGAGLKKAGAPDGAAQYLAAYPAAVLAQPYHTGPFEAGIFYYRMPGEATGHVFSITDKQFPELVGDGRSTVEQLIWMHPRHRMQAGRFLARHADQIGRVLADGERFRLAVAGNHCQGTLFRDGAHLLTPELERTIDAIARSFDGFYFGRFDVRYTDVEAFKAGRDLAIIELNGVTSESTNIYDPSWPLARAYAALGRQWSILFRIADANVRAGRRPTPTGDLLRALVSFYRGAGRPATLGD